MSQRVLRGFLLILLVSQIFSQGHAYFSFDDYSVTDVAGAQEAGAAYLSDAVLGQGSDVGDDYFEISNFRPNKTNMVFFLIMIVAISVIVEAKSGFVRKKVRKNR